MSRFPGMALKQILGMMYFIGNTNTMSEQLVPLFREIGVCLVGSGASAVLCACCALALPHSGGIGTRGHGHAQSAVRTLRTNEPDRMTATWAYPTLFSSFRSHGEKRTPKPYPFIPRFAKFVNTQFHGIPPILPDSRTP